MTTYYVDSTRPDDSGNGLTPETAKQTIAAALALITADGCTLRFVGGSQWDTPFRIASYNNITYEAYGAGNNPIIRIATLIATGDWSAPDGNGCYTVAATDCYWFIEDSRALKKGSGITLPEAGTWYFSSGTIYYKPSSGTPSNHVTEKVVGNYGMAILSPATPIDLTGTVIDGLDVRFALIRMDGFYGSKDLTPFTLKNCLLTEIYDNAFDFRTDIASPAGAVTIQNNTFTANYNNVYFEANYPGMYVNPWIVGNTVAKSNLLFDGSTPWNPGDVDTDGFSIQNMRNGIIELNNISGRCCNSSGHSAGIVVWQPTGPVVTTGNIIRKNFIHDIYGSGISYSGDTTPDTDVQIYDNIISNFGQLGLGVGNNPITPRGMDLNKAQSSSTKSGVYNNTIRTGPSGLFFGTQADYYIVRNNIVAECTYAVELEAGWNSGMVADHNLYHPVDGNNFKVGGVEKTLTQYQAIVTPDDSDVLTTEPLFIGGSYQIDTSFKLQSGSPCINAGVDVGLTTDYGGESIVGVPDIGAWEFGGGFRKIYVGGLQCNLTVI